jgi:hypothetical protein
MIQLPLLGVGSAPSAVSARTVTCSVSRAAELLYAVGTHDRTGASVPQIAALDPDIARVERAGIAASTRAAECLQHQPTSHSKEARPFGVVSVPFLEKPESLGLPKRDARMRANQLFLSLWLE